MYGNNQHLQHHDAIQFANGALLALPNDWDAQDVLKWFDAGAVMTYNGLTRINSVHANYADSVRLENPLATIRYAY